MMNKIVSLLVCAFVATPAFAALKNVKEYSDAWGGRPFKNCVNQNAGHNFPDGAWLGTSNDRYKAYDGECVEGYGRKALIAVEVKSSGAKFCPIFIRFLFYIKRCS